jgi:hypothetical protein
MSDTVLADLAHATSVWLVEYMPQCNRREIGFYCLLDDKEHDLPMGGTTWSASPSRSRI